MQCTKDNCNCSLCRELQNCKAMISTKHMMQANGNQSRLINNSSNRLNDNFILKRRSATTITSMSSNINSNSSTSTRNTTITTTTTTTTTTTCTSVNTIMNKNTNEMDRPVADEQHDIEQMYDLCKRRTSTPSPTPIIQAPLNSVKTIKIPEAKSNKLNHKVVIYFGDSLASRHKQNVEVVEDISSTTLDIGRNETANETLTPVIPTAGINSTLGDDELPPYIESIYNGVITIKIEDNYAMAEALVHKIVKSTQTVTVKSQQQIIANTASKAETLPTADAKDKTEHSNNLDDGDGGDNSVCYADDIHMCDWSFVQKWRARPVGNLQSDMQTFNGQQNTNNIKFYCNTGATVLWPSTHITNAHNTNSNMKILQAPMQSHGSVQDVQITTPITKNLHKQTPQRSQPPASTNYACNAIVTESIHDNANSSYSIDNLQQRNSNTSSNTANTVSKSINSYRTSMLKLNKHQPTYLSGGLNAQGIPTKTQPLKLSVNLNQSLNTSLNTANSNDKFKYNSNATTPSAAAAAVAATATTTTLRDSNYLNNEMKHTPKINAIPTHTHHHEYRTLERVQECNSSSDENRSSGHASMSDTGGHCSSSPGGGIALCALPEDRLAAGVTNRSTRSRTNINHSRPRHRVTPMKTTWNGNGLEDIRIAIQQLTMRSQTSTSTYSSLSAGSESSEPAKRLDHYASLETVNTNVTHADEFVWVDSHNRLVELQTPPWSQQCIINVIRNGRCKDSASRILSDAVSRLSYMLQRALVRIAREVQRLASNLGLCSKHEIAGAFKIVLCPAIADSCIKACLRAAAMFAMPGDSALKQSKSARAGLQLPVGKFHSWMVDARLGKFIHEYAAVYMCAGIENLLEEILLQSLPSDVTTQLTAAVLEHAISMSGDLWGLLQPFAHLNAGRVASGALTIPRWASQSSLGTATTHSSSTTNKIGIVNVEPYLLTTCVGSINELKELSCKAQQNYQHTILSNSAISALFYFMRCSQLEHNEFIGQQGVNGGNAGSTNGSQNIQLELCYERAFIVLPPLVEWLRVASVQAEYRNAIMIDKDDIMQAARLLLPGVDCPPRPIGYDEELPMKKTYFSPLNGASTVSIPNSISENTTELGKRATVALAFKFMLTGRAELLAQASNLLPPTTRYDTINHAGMTALMIASIRNDSIAIQALLDAGCDPNIEVPNSGTPNCPAIHPDVQHWTAVTFAAAKSNYIALRMLLERGGKVEGGARQSAEKYTLTPLQVACGTANIEIISLLLAHGANAFLSTQQKDSMSFAGSAQRGCYCAISVAAAHGHKTILRKLLSTPLNTVSKDVLSLEEMLAEGDIGSTTRSAISTERLSTSEMAPILNKTQIKSLQEAMYHSAENNHLDITIELRTLGVPWTLHCWMHALATAHELCLDAVIDQLLQDFLQVCPDDYSGQFVCECLPLLFNIFQYSKNEGTTLLLADIFATCYGWELIKPIEECRRQPIGSSRIDPKFVNNPELSDVTFQVEGKIFYGHKIVLVTASPRFQNMLSTKISDGSTPTVQINDIRYHIFQLVMQYLYSGGCVNLDVSKTDVLELMAAASFFQLDGLLRFTESRCSKMIDIDNVVAIYIHAKVYNANNLLEFCQGFLLQNMVALLTYDDSVKRLLFAKKILNHNVLSALLQTLQQRISERSKAINHLGGGNLFQQQLTNSTSKLNAPLMHSSYVDNNNCQK